MIETLIARLPSLIAIVLLCMGLYTMIVRRNFVRKLIGLTVFQTAIILFFVSLSPKLTGGVPIGSHDGMPPPDQLHDPLPHVLMLTAIVVGVSTVGVALAILLRVHARYGSLDEDEVFERIEA